MNTAVLDKSQPGRDGTVACGASAPQDVSCPLVSIVVPVWGAEKFLPTFLDTVLAQTMPDWECVLVEDGSPDNSAAICDAYAARDNRFRVIHQTNKGVCPTMNTGIRAARGTYITVMDNDDRIHPRLLEWAVSAAEAVPDGFVCWRYTRSLDNFVTGAETGAWKLYTVDNGFFTDRTLGWTQWNKLYIREDVLNSGVFFDEDWYTQHRPYGEDKDFQDRLLSVWMKEKTVHCAMIDDCLYYWNPGNQNSISRLKPTSSETAEKAFPTNYWPHVYAQMATHQALYPDADHAWPHDLRFMRCFYLRVLAYALCCAKANGEKTPPLGRCKELTALLNSCKAEKTWSVYYLPFRLRQKWLVRFIYRLDESGNRNFGRFDWGFYYLLGGNWNR